MKHLKRDGAWSGVCGVVFGDFLGEHDFNKSGVHDPFEGEGLRFAFDYWGETESAWVRSSACGGDRKAVCQTCASGVAFQCGQYEGRFPGGWVSGPYGLTGFK